MIEFARQTASDPKRVSEKHIDTLCDTGFDDADVIELLTFVSYAVASNTIVDMMNIHPVDRNLDLPEYQPGQNVD